MSKKMKLAIAVTCMAVVGCCGGVGYVMYNTQQNMDESTEVIARLEEKLDEAADKAEKTEKELKKANIKIGDLKEQNKELEIAVDEASESIETLIPEATSTSEPTAAAAPDRAITVEGDEFSDGYCYRHDHTGTFQTAPGSGWDLTMRIQPADAGTTGQDTTNLYTVQIEDRMPGAHGINLWGGLGSFADDHCTLNITEMTHYIDTGSALETVQTGETGVIRHDGDDKYWDNYSESMTVGPFTWSS